MDRLAGIGEFFLTFIALLIVVKYAVKTIAAKYRDNPVLAGLDFCIN